MECLKCGNENSTDFLFCGSCGTSLILSASNSVVTDQDNSIRYHGLDMLRGTAMLLGIVLHAALPYVPDIEKFWPADENSSDVISTIFHFIHIWRMPLFFILAGFFANLLISRKSWKSWWQNRLLRIALPSIMFVPLMSLTLPWIFKYGRTGEFIFFYTGEGQPFHLWFLWHLIIFTLITAILGPIYLLGVRSLQGLNKIGLRFIVLMLYKSKSIVSSIVFRSRYPIVFIILCCLINARTWGELILNPEASGLYFVLGYSLYGNPTLFAHLKTNWSFYLLAAMVGFVAYMTLHLGGFNSILNNTSKEGYEISKTISDLLELFKYIFRNICAVLFSYAFIGLVENRFSSYNAKLRFISDGSYWMYLIHLPIVTLITFLMFKLRIPIEIKFLTAITITSIICLVTYKYVVRSTFIGILLNGRRYPFRIFGL